MAAFKTITQVMLEPGVLLPPGATVELTEDQAAPLLASGCLEAPAAKAESEAEAETKQPDYSGTATETRKAHK